MAESSAVCPPKRDGFRAHFRGKSVAGTRPAPLETRQADGPWQHPERSPRTPSVHLIGAGSAVASAPVRRTPGHKADTSPTNPRAFSVAHGFARKSAQAAGGSEPKCHALGKSMALVEKARIRRASLRNSRLVASIDPGEGTARRGGRRQESRRGFRERRAPSVRRSRGRRTNQPPGAQEQKRT